MNTNMRKRLDELESKLGGGNQIICVTQYLDETAQDARAKVDRWREGKTGPYIWTRAIRSGQHSRPLLGSFCYDFAARENSTL